MGWLWRPGGTAPLTQSVLGPSPLGPSVLRRPALSQFFPCTSEPEQRRLPSIPVPAYLPDRSLGKSCHTRLQPECPTIALPCPCAQSNHSKCQSRCLPGTWSLLPKSLWSGAEYLPARYLNSPGIAWPLNSMGKSFHSSRTNGTEVGLPAERSWAGATGAPFCPRDGQRALALRGRGVWVSKRH